MRVIPGNWLAVRGSSGSFFLLFCANGKEMKKRNEHERDRHLYFIGLDDAMPVKLMPQLSRGGVEMKSKRAKKGKVRGETGGDEKNGET